MNIKDNVLNEIRQDYFDIVEVNDDSVTLKSICTGHSWCLSLEGGVIKMLHKNHDKDKYHAMHKAGYEYDLVESTDDNIRFYSSPPSGVSISDSWD